MNSTIENINIYSSNDNIYINFPSDNKEKYCINIYNLLGQIIYKETLVNPSNLHKIQFNGAGGNYIVNVTSNNFVCNKKVSLFR